ncbi:nitroreductase family deazaflavin-dependent oxidoreductase [Saccharopolyspora sp. NFXS83]|uniref:nitroreductase family deazaflavin-dependent oxidoreductase n=1 Tax=Saccharopolyspora sp. NFXS83 TaxID=2993560 RepID=UPI00224B2876|nr:nitroreductase family deazaflavin-dependent oxidoreductase [Saccharopolyspora sp. NFXS83]MCX2731119.1 nitroreductase family deazaflavin-dependent oxidoreductase [Saccharopolyspora sp. NFXS83]
MRRPRQLDSPLVPKVMRVMSRAHVRAYRATGGRIGGRWRIGSAWRRGVPTCLLTTTGRKSGQDRTTPLLYLRDGQRVVLVASQGGLPRHPAWYHNITANPEVTVQIGKEALRLRARVAEGPERAELWAKLLELYADFDSYQSWTDRTIPVVVCEPAK